MYDGSTVRLCPLLAAMGVVLSATAARASGVAVVVAHERDVAAAEHVAAGLGAGVVRRVASAPEDVQLLLEEARRAWPEELVVVLDTGRRSVRVLRVSDGTVLSRVLEHLVAERSPYAVSVAALELLELVGFPPRPPEAEPPPEPARPEPPPAPVSFPVQPPRAPASVRPDPGPSPAFVVLGGAMLDAAADGDLALVQPALGAEFQLRFRPWVATAGARVSAFGGRQRSVAPGAGADQIFDADVEYARTDVGLRAGFGTRDGDATALAIVQGGLGFVSVTGVGELRDGGPSRDGEVSRLVPWFGGGGELRYGVGAGLGIGLDVGVAFQPSSASYTVDGTSAYDEGNYHVRGGVLAFWESP